jgi:hypothetical protein
MAVVLGLVIFCKIIVSGQSFQRDDDVHVPRLPDPLSRRIQRGFYADGIWSIQTSSHRDVGD